MFSSFNFIAKNDGETKVVGVKIQLIEIMKTGPGKIVHFKDMKKVFLFLNYSAQIPSLVSQCMTMLQVLGQFSFKSVIGFT